MRVLLAGLVGGLILFAWGAAAHMVTPLGKAGFARMDPADEEDVLDEMKSAMTERRMYMVPGFDMDDSKGMEQEPFKSRYEAGPTALVAFSPGPGSGMHPTKLATELGLNVVEALIAAFIVTRLNPGTWYPTRVLVVTLIGLSAALGIEGSYWNWYCFPTEYFVAQGQMAVIGALLSGLVIAKVAWPRSDRA